MEFVAECRQKYGPVFKIWLGWQLNVTFCDPEDVKVRDILSMFKMDSCFKRSVAFITII